MFDVAKAREFYVDFLGFVVDWEHRFADDLPLYMQLSSGTAVLHLSEHCGDGVAGVHVRISTGGLESYALELNAKGYRFARPGIERAPWGELTMTIDDPFGNRLTFAERTDREP